MVTISKALRLKFVGNVLKAVVLVDYNYYFSYHFRCHDVESVVIIDICFRIPLIQFLDMHI